MASRRCIHDAQQGAHAEKTYEHSDSAKVDVELHYLSDTHTSFLVERDSRELLDDFRTASTHGFARPQNSWHHGQDRLPQSSSTRKRYVAEQQVHLGCADQEVLIEPIFDRGEVALVMQAEPFKVFKGLGESVDAFAISFSSPDHIPQVGSISHIRDKQGQAEVKNCG